jgi:hypothetical protein
MEVEPREYELICNATGNELPEMVEHWAKLERMLGLPIKKVGHTTDLYGLIDEQQMLPNFRARWCTRILKIEPTIKYFESLPDGSVLYVGLRADEEARRGIYGEDMKIRFPMREWGWNEADVWKYLASRDVTIPKRTDCAVCPYQRLGEWRDLWRDYPEEYARGVPKRLFSEFNILGYFTEKHEADRYRFTDTDAKPMRPACARQFWTVDGLTPANLAELAAMGFHSRWPSTLSPLDKLKRWLSQTTRHTKQWLKSRRPF